MSGGKTVLVTDAATQTGLCVIRRMLSVGASGICAFTISRIVIMGKSL